MSNELSEVKEKSVSRTWAWSARPPSPTLFRQRDELPIATTPSIERDSLYWGRPSYRYQD